MDPINILIGLNLIATFGMNFSGAKKGLKTSLTNVRERPKTFLQNVPPNLSAFILVLIIISVFQVGTLGYNKYSSLFPTRIAGLTLFLVFTWFQIWASKSLGEYNSNEIVILRSHELVTSGPFRYVRHPVYLGQILADLGASLALLSYIILPIVILIEIPILIARAVYEDKFLEKYFKEKFIIYKKRSGLLLPFIG